MKKNKILTNIINIVIVMCVINVTAVWAEVDLNPQHPDSYVVVKGDTLWDIAGRFLKYPWQWPEIWRGNSQIANPDLIYPGDIIHLIYVDGQPILTSDGNYGNRPRTGELRVTKLSPKSRVQNLDRAVHTIPIDAIRQFLTENRVLAPGELKASPYIVGIAGEHVAASHGNKIYIRGLKSGKQEAFSVFRSGDIYTNPHNKKDILGYEAIFLGDTHLLAYGDPSTFFLNTSNREILRGDHVLPRTESKINSRFFPRPPNNKLEAHIISVFNGVTQINRHNVVVIDLGEKHGMKAGIVLDIYRAGETIDDKFGKSHGLSNVVRLPDERAGALMVFRTFERVSYALVMQASLPIHVMDKVKTPEIQ
jgi:hypothetical protein